MLKTFTYTVLADSLGAWDAYDGVSRQRYITGKFLGYQIRNTTLIGVSGALSVELFSTQDSINQNDSLFTLSSIADTDFVDVRYQCVDTSGNAIVGEYDHQYCINCFVRPYYNAGSEGDTFDLELLFDIEETASYTA